jgi:large subunit ribosomal protein L9
MRVILTEDVSKLGEMGEVVDVADGYGRNFLIPQGLALPAGRAGARKLRHQAEQIEAEKQRQIADAREILDDIDGISITVPRRTADDEHLYGSVTNRDVAETLEQQGFEIDRKKIELDEPLKELGIYKVPIKLASGIYAYVRVWVVAM